MIYKGNNDDHDELFSGYYIVTLCMILCSPLKCYFALVRKYYLKWKILFEKQLKRVALIVTSWLHHSVWKYSFIILPPLANIWRVYSISPGKISWEFFFKASNNTCVIEEWYSTQ